MLGNNEVYNKYKVHGNLLCSIRSQFLYMTNGVDYKNIIIVLSHNDVPGEANQRK